jgi:ankyrin repeat protein
MPDALANEADVPPLNSVAIEMVEKLRTGDRQSFLKLVAKNPQLLNARGPEGSTPFMYAVLYSDVATLAQLLKKEPIRTRATTSTRRRSCGLPPISRRLSFCWLMARK